MGQVLVVGSLNMDLLIQSAKLPKPGETVMGLRYLSSPGGKGANQACAAAKFGSSVKMLGCTGNDRYGALLRKKLEEAGIDTDSLLISEDTPTGTAFVMTDAKGQNSIIVIPGANDLCTREYIEANDMLFQQADCVLIQLEIPLDGVEAAICSARRNGCKVVLNPAPARADISDELLSMVDVITPNETELSALTGYDTELDGQSFAGMKELLAKGVKNVVVTLGEHGVLIETATEELHIPANKVSAVDSTGAGDCFSGVMTAMLSDGESLVDAARTANLAASVSVTRQGAMCSMPARYELYDG